MRQGQNSKRTRGRGVGGVGSGGGGGGGGGRRNVSPRHQTFDSNGPSIRIRGSAHQVHEKYLALARDAGSVGDRIAAENYLQHAEHYFRIINPDGDGQNRSQQNGADDNQGENARDEFGRPQNESVEMTSVRTDGEGVAPAVEVIQANGGDEQPDPDGDQPDIDGGEAAGAEAPAPKRGRPPRGNGRSRGPRASSRKSDAGDGDSNGADTGNQDTPQTED